MTGIEGLTDSDLELGVCLREGIVKQVGTDTAEKGNVKILTNCPACVQGLSRYADSTGIDTDYIVVEVMKHLHGDNWNSEFVERVSKGGIEKVLL